MNKGNVFIISGPSGAGKGTIVEEILKKRNDLFLSISATSRKPREGEIDGESYFFITKEEFKEQIDKSLFLEHSFHYDNYYGTYKKTVKDKISKGINVILEIDINGAKQIKENSDCILIFVLPPSINELKKRIEKRNSENEQEIKDRIIRAYKEIATLNEYDYFIVNDDVINATNILNSIIESSNYRVTKEFINKIEEDIKFE